MAIVSESRRSCGRFDVLLLAALALEYALVAFLPFGPKKFGDGDFHIEAKALAAFLRGAGNFADLALTKAPAPSLFYTLPYLLLPPGSPDGRFWAAGIIWNALWMGACLLLVRRTAALLAGDLAGRIAPALLLATPFTVYYGYGILAEGPALLGACVFTYGWATWRAGTPKSAPAARMACVGMIVLLLSRPSAILVIPIAAVCAIILYRRRALDAAAGSAAGFAARMAIWPAIAVAAATIAVRPLPGRPGADHQAAHLSKTVLIGRIQFRTDAWDWRFWTRRDGSADFAVYSRAVQDINDRARRSGVPAKDLDWRWGVEDMAQHPLMSVRQAAIRLLYGQVNIVHSVGTDHFRLGPWHGPSAYWMFHIAVNAANALFLGAALWFLWARRRALASWWPLWGPWAALLAFHSVIYMEPRYLFPVRAALAVMAACALAPTLARRRRFTAPPGSAPDSPARS